jgi:hypothetical protein
VSQCVLYYIHKIVVVNISGIAYIWIQNLAERTSFTVLGIRIRDRNRNRNRMDV